MFIAIRGPIIGDGPEVSSSPVPVAERIFSNREDGETWIESRPESEIWEVIGIRSF